MLILELSQDIVSNDVYCCLKYIVVKYNYYKLFLEDYNHCIGFDVFYFSEIDLYNYIYIYIKGIKQCCVCFYLVLETRYIYDVAGDKIFKC